MSRGWGQLTKSDMRGVDTGQSQGGEKKSDYGMFTMPAEKQG